MPLRGTTKGENSVGAGLAPAPEGDRIPLAALGDDVRGRQSQSQEELVALLPSILDKAFKGEL